MKINGLNPIFSAAPKDTVDLFEANVRSDFENHQSRLNIFFPEIKEGN